MARWDGSACQEWWGFFPWRTVMVVTFCSFHAVLALLLQFIPSCNLSIALPYHVKMESKLVNEHHANSGKWDNPRRIKVDAEKGRVREESPSIRLCLGISSDYEKTSHVIKEGKSVFTAAQLQDLHQQFLIFKYIAAGFPLPIELIRPIWNSVTISLGSATGRIHTQYPNFVGFSPLGFDYMSMMDPEPGRCKRTDGKKWRCSKDVVPEQKYCERHMHRGRGRLRKHVKASEITSDSATTTSTTTATVLWNGAAEKINNGRSNAEFVNGKDAEYKHLSRRINIRESVNYAGGGGSLVASGFGFSPNSALQVLGCSSSCRNYRNAIETELERCRRTDGKKWRCGGDVVPGHKYCERHLHRGTKKLTAAAQPVSVTAAPLPPSFCLAIPKKEGGYMNLDTNLSISSAARPGKTTNDEKSCSTTSSSDATTISDENSSISHLLALSP